jgi:pyridoxamine 5'-phosphate oxidase
MSESAPALVVESTAPFGEPFERFGELLDGAGRRGLPEPTAMSLATADAAGRPSVRMVLLKGYDERGFVFYTNLESRKARELTENPFAALCFHWVAMETQVRIEGRAEPVSGAEADAYYATRPRGSRIGAWASAQSRPLAAYAELETRVKELEARYGEGDIPRPPFWSGFRVVPERIEFWFGRPNRLHERDLYTRLDGDPHRWRKELLYP